MNTNFLKFLSLAGLAAFVFASMNAQAELKNNWQTQWDDCRDYQALDFQVGYASVQSLFRRGMSWENQVNKEVQEINDVVNTTCKQWAENPNGDAPLKEFIRRFTQISTSALALKQEAEESLSPRLDRWIKSETESLAMLGFKFENFRCGRAFANTRRGVQTELQKIEQKFDELKSKCPAAADEIIAKSRKAGPSDESYGKANGGPARSPSSKSIHGASDITSRTPLPTGGK